MARSRPAMLRSAATNDDSIIIPGHGKPVSNKAELKEFRDMLAAIRDKSRN